MAPVTVTRSREWWGFYRRILVEVDGTRVGGVSNGRDLKIDVPPGPHTFRAFMGWIGSKPLEVDVHEGSVTALGVRAPWREAAAAKISYVPLGPQAQGVGHYTSRKPDEGLDIWEHPMSPDQIELAAQGSMTRREVLGIWAILAVEAVLIAAGPLIALFAGASTGVVIAAGMAGPAAIFIFLLTGYVFVSCVRLWRGSHASQR